MKHLALIIFYTALFMTPLFSTHKVEVLLNDAEEMEKYIEAFPFDSYDVCYLPEQGYFYVDKIYNNKWMEFSFDRDDWIKLHLANGYSWEPHIQELLKKNIKPGSNVIDVGAHIGTHSISMAKFTGPTGRVMAFEPQRKIFRELHWNIILNQIDNIDIFRYAIGHEHRIVQMDLSEKGNEGGTKIGSGGDFVELRTLDSFNFKNVSLIKMDVEEFEDYTLQGAEKTISNNKPIIIIEIMGKWGVLETAPEWVKLRVERTKHILNEMGYKVDRISVADYIATPVIAD